jgi:hypothetical protein
VGIVVLVVLLAPVVVVSYLGLLVSFALLVGVSVVIWSSLIPAKAVRWYHGDPSRYPREHCRQAWHETLGG